MNSSDNYNINKIEKTFDYMTQKENLSFDQIMRTLLKMELENMRDATKEEQKKVNSYIDSILEDTGLNFWDIVDGKFVDESGVYEFKNWEFVKVK